MFQLRFEGSVGFLHIQKRAARGNHEQWFGVEQYIQHTNPVGKNKSTFINQSTGILFSTYYVLIMVLIIITIEISIQG